MSDTRAARLLGTAEPSAPVEWPAVPSRCTRCLAHGWEETRDFPDAGLRQVLNVCASPKGPCSRPVLVRSEKLTTLTTDGGRTSVTVPNGPMPKHLLPVEARKPLRGTVPPQATCARGDHPEAVDEFAEVVRLLQRMTPATQDAAVAAARAITADRRRRRV